MVGANGINHRVLCLLMAVNLHVRAAQGGYGATLIVLFFNIQ
jgi:hypothetical protein